MQQGLSAGYMMIISSIGAANTKGVLKLLQYFCKCGFSEVVGYERAEIWQLAWSWLLFLQTRRAACSVPN